MPLFLWIKRKYPSSFKFSKSPRMQRAIVPFFVVSFGFVSLYRAGFVRRRLASWKRCGIIPINTPLQSSSRSSAARSGIGIVVGRRNLLRVPADHRFPPPQLGAFLRSQRVVVLRLVFLLEVKEERRRKRKKNRPDRSRDGVGPAPSQLRLEASGGQAEDAARRDQRDLVFLEDGVQEVLELGRAQRFEPPGQRLSDVEAIVDVFVDVRVLDWIGGDLGDPVDSGG
mmetsp:Transcript_9863/g.20637  ORF Transcript_9863/g.20637 Transcript_9863/m.20637 type:complete len:226 (+) Transcript_9863:673-1350(+)